jgi:hypothetical protein
MKPLRSQLAWNPVDNEPAVYMNRDVATASIQGVCLSLSRLS